MNDIEVGRKLSRPYKALIVALLTLSFIIVFLPLWQMGSESTLSVKVASADEAYADEDAQRRALRAAIAAGEPDIEEQYFFSAGISRNDYLR